MNEFPSISIVIPSWNQGIYIERTLLSILKQDYPGEVMVIVSDGGSTDSTVEVLRKYDNQIIWWSVPDKGFVDAVTKGLVLATGDLIAIQSSDDFYLEGAFRSIAKAFHLYPDASFITGGEYNIDLDENIVHAMNPGGAITPLSVLFNFPPQHATFIKREYLEQVGGLRSEVDMCADIDLWYRVSHLSPGHYITDFIAAYQRHPNQRIRTSLKWYSNLVSMVETCENDPFYSQKFKITKAEKWKLYSYWRMLWPDIRDTVEAHKVGFKMLPLYFSYDARTKEMVYNHSVMVVRNLIAAGLKNIISNLFSKSTVEKIKKWKSTDVQPTDNINLFAKIDNSWFFKNTAKK